MKLIFDIQRDPVNTGLVNITHDVEGATVAEMEVAEAIISQLPMSLLLSGLQPDHYRNGTLGVIMVNFFDEVTMPIDLQVEDMPPVTRHTLTQLMDLQAKKLSKYHGTHHISGGFAEHQVVAYDSWRIYFVVTVGWLSDTDDRCWFDLYGVKYADLLEKDAEEIQLERYLDPNFRRDL